MKTILISIIFFTFVYSDSLVSVKNGVSYCVSDNYYESGKSYVFTMLPHNVFFALNQKDINEIKSGYKYNPNTSNCELIETPKPPNNDTLIMGMKEEDYHFSLAIWGIMLASVMSFGLIKAL